MLRGLVIHAKVDFSLLPFWLGLHIERYGCPGLGHRGISISMELGVVELMLSVGRRYME